MDSASNENYSSINVNADLQSVNVLQPTVLPKNQSINAVFDATEFNHQRHNLLHVPESVTTTEDVKSSSKSFTIMKNVSLNLEDVTRDSFGQTCVLNGNVNSDIADANKCNETELRSSNQLYTAPTLGSLQGSNAAALDSKLLQFYSSGSSNDPVENMPKDNILTSSASLMQISSFHAAVDSNCLMSAQISDSLKLCINSYPYPTCGSSTNCPNELNTCSDLSDATNFDAPVTTSNPCQTVNVTTADSFHATYSSNSSNCAKNSHVNGNGAASPSERPFKSDSVIKNTDALNKSSAFRKSSAASCRHPYTSNNIHLESATNGLLEEDSVNLSVDNTVAFLPVQRESSSELTSMESGSVDKLAGNVVPQNSNSSHRSNEDPSRRPDVTDSLYKCPKCEAFFTSDKHRKNHLETHHTFKCIVCNYSSEERSMYEQHMGSAHLGDKIQRSSEGQSDNSILMCEICDRIFLSDDKLRQHAICHSVGQKHKCDRCDKSFADKFALTRHQNTHESKNLPCGHCGKIFKHELTLSKHMANHKEMKSSCKVCDKVYRTKEGLKVHMSVHATSGNECKCLICGRDFRCKNYLRIHLKAKHLNGRELSCADCGKKFKYKQSLSKHRMIAHNNKPDRKFFECECCCKKFLNSQSLRIHMVKHRDVKEFSCQVCGDRFKYSHSRDKHELVIHSDVKEFQCSTCGKMFKTERYLNLHVQDVHVASEPIPCLYCDKKFKTKKNMRSHVTVSHLKVRQKKHVCSYCGFAFLSPKDCMRHEKIHTGVKDHVCESCGRRFSRIDNLRSHQKTHSQKNVSK